jgi:cleavage and polyadenylation specificity factor subunit 1
LFGIQLSRTIAYHPAANGLVERFHRTLKAAIMCHADQQWTGAMPLVLLGIRTFFKADLQASVAELVYGEPLSIPGELLTPTADPVEPALLITQLRRHMARLRPVPVSHHASSATFVHKDLHNCTHVFLRQDATLRPLEPPYSDPYQVLSRREKRLKLLVRGKPVTVSADRVKPAYVLNEADCGSTIFNPLASATPDIAPHPATQTIRCSRRVRFPARFNP